jgi:dihydroorotate dehydrogenase
MNEEFLRKLLFKFEPEVAHNIFNAVFSSLSYLPQVLNFITEDNFVTNKALSQNLFNTNFINPVGLAAGFDKNATMIKGMHSFGFGHMELGTITKLAQKGNPKPRMFRYIKEKSIQNAMGFNNQGSFKIASRMQNIYPYSIPLGINIGKNKNVVDEDEIIKDYIFLVNTFSDISDYITINISSPNTKNLRKLQNNKFVETLLKEINKITKQDILIKLSPDMNNKDAISLAQCCIDNKASGIILTNTTSDYSLIDNAKDFGGISGAVLKEKSLTMLKEVSKEIFGKCKIISVGGISTSEDAYERIIYGANLVQIYTSLIYNGIHTVKNINKGILEHLRKDGFTNITEAVGCKIK